MKRKKSSRIWIVAGACTGLAFLTMISSGVGVYLGNHFAQDRMSQELPPIQLKAGTAARTKSLSMATGLVDNNAEALFVLDHVSGNLQCWLLNSRTGSVGGIFTANVAADLMMVNKTGEPDYVMTTGNFFFTGNTTGNVRRQSQSVTWLMRLPEMSSVTRLSTTNKPFYEDRCSRES